MATVLACLSFAAVGSVGAGPFDASALTPIGGPPREGDIYTYRLSVAAAPETSGIVEIHVPHAAMFVRLDGLDGAEWDHEARAVRWQGTIQISAPRPVTLTLVAGVDAGGHVSSLHVTLRPWQGAPTYLEHSVEVDTRPAPAAFSVGRVGVAPAGVAVLGWLASGVLFWLVLKVVRPRDANWAPIVIMLPAGFLLYFAALAREDVRILALPETTCTVVDRVLDSRTTSSSAGARRSGPQTIYAPRLALLHQRDGSIGVAQGFGTDSRLSGTSASRVEGLLTRYAIGSRVPCAIDTRDPRRAYVERGFGGAYVFALIPLPLLLVGLWGFWKRW